MYKAAVRRMVRRNIRALSAGDRGPTLAMFTVNAELVFPGDNSWSRMFREPQPGRDAFVTHRGRVEIDAFLQRYVEHGLQMHVEDILVNGPPWRARAAVRVRVWAPDGDEPTDVYANRAVLMVETRWGRIQRQEDYEDTERAAAFDQVLRTREAALEATPR